MKQIKLGSSGKTVPAVAIGCMRINSLELTEVEHLIKTAMENGANFFDHADIYGGGECEEIFAKAVGMTPEVREKMIIQSKCGIVPGVRFDFSKDYILNAVDGILNRLKTDYLDILLLHRPDALVEPEEVAEAFDRLYSSGKVRGFGVSNQNPMQMQLLQKYVKQPLLVNQLQLGLAHSHMITQGIHVNMMDEGGINRDGSVLDFCRLNDITVQAWSPMQYGFFEGVFLGSDKYPELNQVINQIAEEKNVSPTTIAIAWIMRHPANIQTIIGTTNTTRMLDSIKAGDIDLTRDEWYELYMAAGNILP